MIARSIVRQLVWLLGSGGRMLVLCRPRANRRNLEDEADRLLRSRALAGSAKRARTRASSNSGVAPRGKPWWRNATIRLSTDIADNCAVRGRIASAWQKLRQRYRDIEAGAWYTVAVANARGELVYFVNSRKTSLYYGPAEPGGRREGLARRELGSFAKVFAALLTARAGDSPETRYLKKRGDG
jgi:hypothetical protein